MVKELFPEAIALKRNRVFDSASCPAADGAMSVLATVTTDENIEWGCDVCEKEKASGRDDSPTTQSTDKNRPDRKRPLKDPPEVIQIDDDAGSAPNSGVQNCFQLRVFQVDSNATTFDDIHSSLSRCCNGSGNQSPEESRGGFVRRSSRKRKNRYPIGAIENEDTVRADLDRNIAATRLLLLEHCHSATPFEVHHRLILAVSVRKRKDFFNTSLENTDAPFQLIELKFDMNPLNLRDLCEQNAGRVFGSDFDPEESVVLIRQACENNTNMPKEELFDHLIAVANPNHIEDKTKKHRTERGFTGTFLSSSIPAKKDQSESSDSARNVSSPNNASQAGRTLPPHPSPRNAACQPMEQAMKKRAWTCSVPKLADTSTSPSSTSQSDGVVAVSNEEPVSSNGRPSIHTYSSLPVQYDSEGTEEDDEYMKSVMQGGLDMVTPRNVLEVLQCNKDLHPFNMDMGKLAAEEAMKVDGKAQKRNLEKLVNKAYTLYLNFTQG